MKIQNILRHAAATAFALAFMWASAAPVHAQEIVNTEFPSGPNVSSFDQNAPNAPVVTRDAAPAVPANGAPVAAVATPTVAQQAAVSASEYIGDTLIASSLFALSLFALYAITEFQRVNSSRPARPHLSQGAALS
jgi:hypothetical protein